MPKLKNSLIATALIGLAGYFGYTKKAVILRDVMQVTESGLRALDTTHTRHLSKELQSYRLARAEEKFQDNLFKNLSKKESGYLLSIVNTVTALEHFKHDAFVSKNEDDKRNIFEASVKVNIIVGLLRDGLQNRWPQSLGDLGEKVYQQDDLKVDMEEIYKSCLRGSYNLPDAKNLENIARVVVKMAEDSIRKLTTQDTSKLSESAKKGYELIGDAKKLIVDSAYSIKSAKENSDTKSANWQKRLTAKLLQEQISSKGNSKQ